MADGDLLNADSRLQEVTLSKHLDENRQKDESMGSWLSGRWIRSQPPCKSLNDRRLYLGTGKLSYLNQGKQYMLDQIDVIDSQSFTHLKSIKPNRPFYSLAISKSGKWIYAISPEEAAITVIDSSTSTEVKTFKGVGVSPILAIASP
ncbi:MAG: YncE family protein [Blastocatellia bacterium]